MDKLIIESPLKLEKTTHTGENGPVFFMEGYMVVRYNSELKCLHSIGKTMEEVVHTMNEKLANLTCD